MSTLVPPKDPARRRRYYGLLGKARKAESGPQRQHLLQLARGLMDRADGERLDPPPPAQGGRPRPRRRPP